MKYLQLWIVSPKTKIMFLLGFFSLAMGFSLSATALSTDRDQPAEIEADDIEFDFKKGTRTYIDNVLVIQGSLRLKADRVDALYVDSELQKATAIGSLARFKQRPDGKKNDVEGWAKKIIVNQKQNTLTLIGKAALKQGPDTARGETIVYNMATDTLKVSGGAKLGASGKDGTRVPKRTLEDPFSDNNQGPVTTSPKTTATPVEPSQAQTDQGTAATSGDTNTDTSTAVQPSATDVDPATGQPLQAEQELPPIKAGRSRLILQPKD